MATKYTANIDYPTHYFRAWMTYEISDGETTYSVSVRYGIALHDSYVSQSWEDMKDRYVAVSTSGAKTTDTGWKQDTTYLSGTGSNWWHQTGTTIISVTKTSSVQSLVLKIWGKVGDGTQETAQVTLSIPKLDTVDTTVTYTIAYEANGGQGLCMTSRHTKDVADTLEPNRYERKGYKFLGWATSKANATNKRITYENNASVTNLSTTNNAVVSLWAVWEPDPIFWINSGTWQPFYKVWAQINNNWEEINGIGVQIDNRWEHITGKHVCGHTNAQTVKLSYCIGTEEWDCCADVGEYQNFTICPSCGQVYVSATNVSGESMSCEDCDTLSDWDNYRDKWVSAHTFLGLTDRSEYKAIYTK